jgi:hypothetical protein
MSFGCTERRGPANRRYADLATAILANAQLQDDGGATVRLTSFQHISRWARQALIGRGVCVSNFQFSG